MKNVTLLLAAIAVMIFGCSKENDAAGDKQVAVRFTAGIDFQTRTSGTSWASGDGIGVYMVDNGTATVSEGAENRLYTTTTGTSTFTTAYPIYFPVDATRKVDFVAYYPYSASIANMTYPVNVSNQATPEDIDLLYARTVADKPAGYDKNDPDVALVLEHKLSKFIIQTVPGSGLTDLTGMTVAINGMNTTANFDLKEGGFSGNAASAVITTRATNDGAQYEAFVLPATSAAPADWTVEFTVGGDTYQWQVPANTELKSGHEHSWTISVQKIPAVLSATIGARGTGTGGSGVAE